MASQFGSVELAVKKCLLASSVLAASSPGTCVAWAGLDASFSPSFPLAFAGLDLPPELAGVSLISPPSSDKHVSAFLLNWSLFKYISEILCIGEQE